MTPAERQQRIVRIKQIMRYPIPEISKVTQINLLVQGLLDAAEDPNSDAKSVILTDGLSTDFAEDASLICTAITMQSPLLFDLFIKKIGIVTVMYNDELRLHLMQIMQAIPVFTNDTLEEAYGPKGLRTKESIAIGNPTWYAYLASGELAITIDAEKAKETGDRTVPGFRQFIDSLDTGQGQGDAPNIRPHRYGM